MLSCSSPTLEPQHGRSPDHLWEWLLSIEPGRDSEPKQTKANKTQMPLSLNTGYATLIARISFVQDSTSKNVKPFLAPLEIFFLCSAEGFMASWGSRRHPKGGGRVRSIPSRGQGLLASWIWWDHSSLIAFKFFKESVLSAHCWVWRGYLERDTEKGDGSAASHLLPDPAVVWVLGLQMDSSRAESLIPQERICHFGAMGHRMPAC